MNFYLTTLPNSFISSLYSLKNLFLFILEIYSWDLNIFCWCVWIHCLFYHLHMLPSLENEFLLQILCFTVLEFSFYPSFIAHVSSVIFPIFFTVIACSFTLSNVVIKDAWKFLSAGSSILFILMLILLIAFSLENGSFFPAFIYQVILNKYQES